MSPRRAAAATLLTAALTLLLAEVVVRVARIPPRLQVVRLTDPPLPDLRFETQDGVDLWWNALFADRLARGDVGPLGAPAVGVVGDSVFEAIEADRTGERLGTVLEQRLKASGVPAEVRDAAWAGYVPEQEAAAFRWLQAERPLDVLVIGVWKEDRRFHRIGGALYDSDPIATSPDGLPPSPVPGVPASVHRVLLTRSRLWEYATLALGDSHLPVRPGETAYVDLIDDALARGVRPVLLEATRLDLPLAEAARQRAAWTDQEWQVRLERHARERGVPYLRLVDVLSGQELDAVRLDACCHLRAAGHALAAGALAPVVAAELQR